ncbi:MAG: hypothetical protein PHD81_00935 [Candidatus Nanoarchaeia archaeon]|nr:hypothetical protein [Candidatus Nanoarchaeia archaeon]MDD5587655.1 hypothetical protein [Candidatus Nanoarchaeia archaeon]
MKKSQIEMFGLLILIILIVISLVIALSFMTSPDEKNEIPLDARISSQAINLQFSLLKADVCENTDFEDVLIKCCTNENICSGNACDIAKGIIKNVTNSTFQRQGTVITFSKYNNLCLNISQGKCIEYAVETYPIVEQQTNYNFKVMVCKK